MTCKELFAKIGCPIPEGCRFYVGATLDENECFPGFVATVEGETIKPKKKFLKTVCKNSKGDFYRFDGEYWFLSNIGGEMEEIGPDFTDGPCNHYFGFDENFDKFYEVYCLLPAVMATV